MVAPDTFITVLSPKQTVRLDAGLIFNVGVVAIPTDTVALLVHPLLSVAFTVYVVLAVGVDTTTDPVELLRVAAGLHVYVLAPAAVIVAELPVHTVTDVGVMVKIGVGLMLTVEVFVLLQIPTLPVTV